MPWVLEELAMCLLEFRGVKTGTWLSGEFWKQEISWSRVSGERATKIARWVSAIWKAGRLVDSHGPSDSQRELPSGAGGLSRERPGQLESASLWCSAGSPCSGSQEGDLKSPINKPYRRAGPRIQRTPDPQAKATNCTCWTEWPLPLCSSFPHLLSPRGSWRRLERSGSGEGKSRRTKEQTMPRPHCLSPMLDLSWIEGRNFKAAVRFKPGFKFELLLSPNGTVLVSGSDQGLKICLKKSPKIKKGVSQNSFEDNGRRKKLNWILPS